MSNRFYAEDLIVGSVIEISGQDAIHMTRVMRMSPGDEIELFDGKGNQAAGTIVDVSKKAVAVTIQSADAVDREAGIRIQVAMPLPKSHRQQFLIEKLTELGVSDLTPLTTERAAVLKANTDKLHRYSIEACKQCLRNHVMQINPITEFKGFINSPDAAGKKYLLDPGGVPISELNRIEGVEKVDFLIGPEGGLTDEEVQLAIGLGWTAISTGPRILRMETAALWCAAWASTSSFSQ